MAAPTWDFHLFVFKTLAFNEITSDRTFGVARDLYRRCKCVVYVSYGPAITWGPKFPYIFLLLFFEAVDQN